MVDNINLTKITPLLPSAEKVKSVDRRPRDSQQPPFKGDQQGKQKKKKKKKHAKDGEELSEVIASRDGPHDDELAEKGNRETKADAAAGRPKKIIDIRV